jgi:predicted ATPase
VALWLALICAAGISGLLAAAVSQRLLRLTGLGGVGVSIAALAIYLGV